MFVLDLDDKSQGIQMKVLFKRVIMNEVLTTYLPTALLIIISYATTFFADSFFEANLTVNLSVMFVMTTLFVSVMEKLPQTSYIRMVDIWLIFGQLLPFVEVVLVTYVEHYRFSLEMKNTDADVEPMNVEQEAAKSAKVKLKQKGTFLNATLGQIGMG